MGQCGEAAQLMGPFNTQQIGICRPQPDFGCMLVPLRMAKQGSRLTFWHLKRIPNQNPEGRWYAWEAVEDAYTEADQEPSTDKW